MTDDDAYINNLYTIGKILWLAPPLLAFLGILYAALTHTNIGFEGNVGYFILGLPMASGLIIMVYASYMTYRKARERR